ncbi:helix-turn-helix domain-containing protein [Aliihoeflea aestuarii]|uniref:AraC family transcriptional regulator n=1 Tax=Aliihoeflea aestuarii TaxID=453840 RepID=UPI002092F0E8|nr:AraC family transcriptional regulator [Aliihoeflea aestuarii]MCO6390837.1 helix-turn-helix domain-containing protein [Aliihoeflea aestuarii]
MDVEPVECGLNARRWTYGPASGERSRQFFLLTDGSGEVEAAGQRFSLSAPALVWIGQADGSRLRMEAGATGFRARVGDPLLVDAVGDGPESAALRHLIDRDFALSLSGYGEAAGVVERCLTGIVRERREPQPGSDLILSALLRIILVSVLRISGGELEHTGAGAQLGLLQRFRQLVEMNFRNHWPVTRYADALGVTTDRLHAICTQGVGKSPKALISERLAGEAVMRLERSSLTIQQLAGSLGFTDPAHFSNFFKSVTGTRPGIHRKAVLEARRNHREPPAPSFAEWP